MNIPLKRYWNLLVAYLRPQWPSVAGLALLLSITIALQLLNPQILRGFIDSAMAGGEPETLTMSALLFIGVALLNQVLSIGTTYLGESVSWTATNALRADLAAHCLRLDLSFHKARTPGELIERVDGDVNALANFFSQFFIHMLGNLVLVVGVLALLFREDWRVGLAMSAFALVALSVLIRIRSFAVPYWTRVRETSAMFFGFLGEQLAGTEDVRSSGATGYVMRRFYQIVRGWLPLQRRAGLAGYSMWTTTLGLFAIGNAIAFGVGATLWASGALTIGTVYMIFYYTELLRQPIEQLRNQLQELQKADAGITRVTELFNTRSKLQEGHGAPIPPGPLSVAFERVSFAYDDTTNDQRPTTNDQRPTAGGQPMTDDEQAASRKSQVAEEAQAATYDLRPATRELVLDNISFELKPGRVLGLLGRTGSGKTTLARLLLRLYDPTAGTVRLGGVPARDACLDDVRRHVGVVTQDVQLFHATVRDNLAFFNPAIGDEQIRAALYDLGLRRWYESLPDGLDTELEAGGALSAGEAQLLAFARLFLADPGLVILDEASSRLDPATEQLIERAVSKLLHDRTAIIIAHRLGTIERADEILILEQGRILEHGDRVGLAGDPDSRFAQLLRAGMEEVLV
jgi:ATP-binding cassette subfamily B protein/ATP-binding cassette subfamily C protein